MRNRLLSLASALLVAGVLVTSLSGRYTSQGGGGWKVVAWNDLGMHCMDGDFSVFTILPPFNTVHAQLIDPNGDLASNATGITLTYEAVADPTGSINTSSAGKTNYWTYAPVLFGAPSTPDSGLTGNDMPGPGNVPQPMSYDAAAKQWTADGIPITPYDDGGHYRTYPLMKIVARSASGTELASGTPVLPISDELDCRLCHGSGSDAAARPAAGWVYDRRSERDHRLNILRIHDERQLGTPTYDDALAQLGYRTTGLYDTVTLDGRPILCASCHSSNALPGTGLAGISALTSALHTKHASVIDPLNGMTLDASENRSSCYRCHPGSETGCLRGAMGAAVATDTSLEMQCQSCHGGMSAVGNSARTGWLEEPACQSCHTGTATNNNGQIRYTSVFEPDGSERVAVDRTFATNPDVPAVGFDLYRFSIGHGGLNCEACHNSTHAILPAAHPNDNILATGLQGHEGTIAECSACHSGNLQGVVDEGPHGLHPFNQTWVNEHKDEVEHNGSAQCAACHAADYRGSVLSRTHGTRSFQINNGSIAFERGEEVGCYACHEGPNSDDHNDNLRPVAQPGSMTVADAAVTTTLSATDGNGTALAYRIVKQPHFGRVGLIGNVATYAPNPGFAGTDSFTFTASDGELDALPGTVSVTRLANSSTYGRGYGAEGKPAPSLGVDAPPKLGTSVNLSVDNVSGSPGSQLLVVSMERASLDTNWGGLLLTELDALYFGALGPVSGSVTYSIPSDIGLIGVSLNGQSIQLDLSAPYRLAFSNGLTLTHGL